MIRRMEPADTERVSEIWLEANREAHGFIPASYWEENFQMVKEMLPLAEVYVWEDTGGIQGFVGLNFCEWFPAVSRHRPSAGGSLQRDPKQPEAESI